jgi:hypothetical protein|nr:MAG TPA: hypothetical protein [Caudoviricetes sp.]
MAKKIKLIMYGLSVVNGQNKRVLLNHMQNGDKFVDVVESYILNKLNNYSTDSKKEILFQFDAVSSEVVCNDLGQEKCRIVYGRVKTGEYGVESDLVDIETYQVSKRSASQADMMPFGFCIVVPAGKVERAVIVLQTTGVFGMKISLQSELRKCMAEFCPDYKLLMNPIAPKEYLDKYLEHGILKKIRMIKYEIPEDEAEKIGVNYGVRDTKEERIIHKPTGFLERKKQALKECIAGQRSHTDIVEITDFKYDDLKLEFSLEGVNKTFDLGNMDSIVISEDITKKVQMENGNPLYTSLKPQMKNAALPCLRDMGLLDE